MRAHAHANRLQSIYFPWHFISSKLIHLWMGAASMNYCFFFSIFSIRSLNEVAFSRIACVCASLHGLSFSFFFACGNCDLTKNRKCANHSFFNNINDIVCECRVSRAYSICNWIYIECMQKCRVRALMNIITGSLIKTQTHKTFLNRIEARRTHKHTRCMITYACQSVRMMYKSKTRYANF